MGVLQWYDSSEAVPFFMMVAGMYVDEDHRVVGRTMVLEVGWFG
jgi:hypothetical protein